MDNNELKKIVSEYLNQGISLSDILKKLDTDHAYKTSFMELRLLAASLEDIKWESLPGEKSAKAAVKEKSASGDVEHIEEDDEEEKEISSDKSEWSQGTVVEINKLVRPGSVLSGSVKFASGASAEWVLDQAGRLMFEKAKGKPTQEDLKEFQMELQRKIGG